MGLVTPQTPVTSLDRGWAGSVRPFGLSLLSNIPKPVGKPARTTLSLPGQHDEGLRAASAQSRVWGGGHCAQTHPDLPSPLAPPGRTGVAVSELLPGERGAAEEPGPAEVLPSSFPPKPDPRRGTEPAAQPRTAWIHRPRPAAPAAAPPLASAVSFVLI